MSPIVTMSTTDLTRTARGIDDWFSHQEAGDFVICCKFGSFSEESEGSTFTAVRNSTLLTRECSHDWWRGKNLEGRFRRPTQKITPALAKTVRFV